MLITRMLYVDLVLPVVQYFVFICAMKTSDDRIYLVCKRYKLCQWFIQICIAEKVPYFSYGEGYFISKTLFLTADTPKAIHHWGTKNRCLKHQPSDPCLLVYTKFMMPLRLLKMIDSA